MPDEQHDSGGPRADVSELVGLVKTYALQETVGPLKQVGRTLAFGSAAALMFGIASLLSLVGLLRALQTETGSVFAGEWSWAPYLITVVAAVALLGVGAAIGLRTPRSEKP